MVLDVTVRYRIVRYEDLARINAARDEARSSAPRKAQPVDTDAAPSRHGDKPSRRGATHEARHDDLTDPSEYPLVELILRDLGSTPDEPKRRDIPFGQRSIPRITPMARRSAAVRRLCWTAATGQRSALSSTDGHLVR